MSDNNESVRRRRFIKYASGMGAGVWLAGCSGGGGQQGGETDTGTSGGGGSTETEESDSTPTSTPSSGAPTEWADMTFKQGSFLNPHTIDPHKVVDNPTYTNAIQMYDPLLTFAEGAKVAPFIAKDWRVSDDGTRVEFDIREGVPFHDGGEIDAEAVAFSMERAIGINQAVVSAYSEIFDGTEVVDDYTVAFKLKKPFGPFVKSLAGRFMIVNPDVILENSSGGDKWAEKYVEKNDAGSGPYILDKKKSGDKITFKAFEDYWQGWVNKAFKNPEYQIISEPSTIRRLLEEAKIHKSDQWLPVTMYQQLDKDKDVNVNITEDFAPLHVMLNHQNKYLADKNVRKALSYALDYQTMVEDIAVGNPKPLAGPLPRNMPFHNPDVKQYTFDLDKAKEHLSKSKFDPGEIELEFTWTSGITELRRIGLLLQSKLSEIGVKNFSINEVVWPNIVEAYTSMDTAFDMISVFWTASYPDPHDILYTLYYSPLWEEGSPTYQQSSFYKNKKVNELLVQARNSVDEQARKEAYFKVQEIVADDAVGVFTYNKRTQIAVNSDVEGYKGIAPSSSSPRSKRWNKLRL